MATDLKDSNNGQKTYCYTSYIKTWVEKYITSIGTLKVRLFKTSGF